jgi:hypothetical protein
VIVAFAFLWGAPRRQREVICVFRTLQRAALGIALAIVAFFFVFPDAFLALQAIYSETLTGASSLGVQDVARIFHAPPWASGSKVPSAP